MGGRTALDLALLHPGRVRALVLIGPAISGAPEAEVEDGVQPLEAAYVAAQHAGDHEELNRIEAHLWLDGALAPEGRVGGAVRELFLRMNATALGAADPGDGGVGVAAWERLGEITVPALVLVGDLDLLEIREGCAHAVRSLPHARLVALPGVAHLPHLEGDEKTLREIAAFVGSLG